jgi:hypothetical protein
VRGTRLATREIIAEPSGECGRRSDRGAHAHIAFSSDSHSQRVYGTTVDAIA